MLHHLATTHRMGLLIPVMLALVLTLASCTTTQSFASKDNNLAAAGFIERRANTAKRQAMLERLPANKFVTRAGGKGVTYVYADPTGCDCLYIGNQDAYDNYRNNQLQARIANRKLVVAQTYSDSLWNWNEWGPFISGFYGPFGEGYGF